MSSKSRNRLFIKPKDEGLSFFSDGDQIHFEVTGKDGEEAVIIASTHAIAMQLAEEHYGAGNFELYEKP